MEETQRATVPADGDIDRGVTLSHPLPGTSFVEMPHFTASISALVSDDEYAAFQNMLGRSPLKGALLRGGGGVRKVRMPAKGKGARGGARIFYLYLPHRGLIFLITLLVKNEAENLSSAGKEQIRSLAEHLKHGHRPWAKNPNSKPI